MIWRLIRLIHWLWFGHTPTYCQYRTGCCGTCDRVQRMTLHPEDDEPGGGR